MSEVSVGELDPDDSVAEEQSDAEVHQQRRQTGAYGQAYRQDGGKEDCGRDE